jgi:threonine/homoserine/homoserine lactone efflux protein
MRDCGVLDASVAGFGSGFLVAAQVGPIWLLCLRSVLRGRFAIGVAIGVGAATVDMVYAGLGVAGAAGVLRTVPQLRLALGLVGASVLVFLGVRTLWSAVCIRAGLETDQEVASPRRAFVTALIATASNPLTIASWAALFTAASSADLARSTFDAVQLVVGVGVGSLTWFTALSAFTALLRRRAGQRGLKVADGVSGLGLTGFGGFLAWRSVHQH